jgi:DNA topoisomerase-1
MKLILVESPTKARTLTRFLGRDYQVEATMGHIRDLPKSTLGVDVDHGFAPSYLVPADKKKRVNELVGYAKKADQIILASDPDREGEAIAWHVSEILKDEAAKKAKAAAAGKSTKTTKIIKTAKPGAAKTGASDGAPQFQRITFHEITETAIKEALNHPGTVDMRLVDAQQARRVLDRLVGYKLSPLLWQKMSKRWLSAGRVQSVAVRLIVEREREITAFAKEPYQTIDGVFSAASGENATLTLVSHEGKKYEVQITAPLFDGTYTTTKTTITTTEQAEAIIADLKPAFTVSAVDRKEIKRSPPAPYTTSTMQQDAGRKLYFSSKKTMQLAQKLYEEGYITYHRTDSVNLAEKFLGEARTFISETYGADYVPAEARKFQTKSKVAQEAHEAIRPTDVTRKSEGIRDGGELNHDHVRLYELIWKRAVASQMKEALFDSTTVAVTSANGYLFQTQGSVVKFDGYLAVTGRDAGETTIPAMTVGETVTLASHQIVPHETTPPPRYSEAGLVKALEEKDIGRPSTYAPIISTIIERQYVKKEEKKLMPTELGVAVTEFLVKYFPEIMSLPFTATMEGSLDSVANGDQPWAPVIAQFWGPFSTALSHASETAGKVALSVETIDEACPQCGNPLVIRTGRYGKFIACSTFPNCRYTRQYGETVANLVCPKCGGAIVVKRSRKGKTFYGCSNYPTCTFAAWRKEDIK